MPNVYITWSAVWPTYQQSTSSLLCGTACDSLIDIYIASKCRGTCSERLQIAVPDYSCIQYGVSEEEREGCARVSANPAPKHKSRSSVVCTVHKQSDGFRHIHAQTQLFTTNCRLLSHWLVPMLQKRALLSSMRGERFHWRTNYRPSIQGLPKHVRTSL